MTWLCIFLAVNGYQITSQKVINFTCPEYKQTCQKMSWICLKFEYLTDWIYNISAIVTYKLQIDLLFLPVQDKIDDCCWQLEWGIGSE